jgi:hypothetical protein
MRPHSKIHKLVFSDHDFSLPSDLKKFCGKPLFCVQSRLPLSFGARALQKRIDAR